MFTVTVATASALHVKSGVGYRRGKCRWADGADGIHSIVGSCLQDNPKHSLAHDCHLRAPGVINVGDAVTVRGYKQPVVPPLTPLARLRKVLS